MKADHLLFVQCLCLQRSLLVCEVVYLFLTLSITVRRTPVMTKVTAFVYLMTGEVIAVYTL